MNFLPRAALAGLVFSLPSFGEESGSPAGTGESPFETNVLPLAASWWSLAPLARPSVPSVEAADNPIDGFISARLAESGLTAAPEAPRRILIRRLFLDLHGLPPTPDEVANFVSDPDPDAYEKLVERLLASPRYGERWARHWLDTIHFADSHGCEHDVKRPNAWPFRDYVIDRLNDDVPWGRFIREQLAADVFYPDESRLLAGLGFLGAGPLELSRAGTAPVTFDYLDRDDMVTQTMTAFTSITANCARCHDHKFDPVSQEDYYALQAVFAGVGKGDIAFDADPDTQRRREKLSALQTAAQNLDAAVVLDSQYAAVVENWEAQYGGPAARWRPLKVEAISAEEGTQFKALADESYLATGPRPETDTYSITGTTNLPLVTGLRLDVLADESLPMHGPGRQDNGNLHLSEVTLEIIEEGREARTVKLQRATADWNQEGWTIAHALDGNPETAWGIYPKVGESHHAVFELDAPLALPADSKLVITLHQLHGGGHLVGRFKIYLTEAPGASASVDPPDVRDALQTAPSKRSQSEKVALAAHVLGAFAKRELEKLPPPTLVYAVSSAHSHGKKLDKPLDKPKTVHVLTRGEIDQPGRVAHPGAIEALRPLPGRFDLPYPEQEETRRAALADWLAAPENPLTWRSIVNRVWHYHFGNGICDTPNDLGRMGGTPTHPELLDWLAHWFRDDARGSLKALHRLILTSATYRQQSQVLNERAAALDSGNRLLWRMNGRRIDAETFRDAILQLSGRLDLTMGGPGVEQFAKHKGPQSTPALDYTVYDWDRPEAARRSIYRVVWRGIADPFMEALDFPDMALLSPERGQSVSALQSLALYNNSFVLHHSQVFAERLERERSGLQSQVERAVELVYLRRPGEDEKKTLLTAYAQQFGLAALARVLFNSNEFLFVE